MAAEREDALREFVAVTGAEEDRARFFLESAGWDLQVWPRGGRASSGSRGARGAWGAWYRQPEAAEAHRHSPARPEPDPGLRGLGQLAPRGGVVGKAWPTVTAPVGARCSLAGRFTRAARLPAWRGAPGGVAAARGGRCWPGRTGVGTPSSRREQPLVPSPQPGGCRAVVRPGELAHAPAPTHPLRVTGGRGSALPLGEPALLYSDNFSCEMGDREGGARGIDWVGHLAGGQQL